MTHPGEPEPPPSPERPPPPELPPPVGPLLPPLGEADVTVPDLVEIWHEAVLGIERAAAQAGLTGWQRPSRCPGWTVADLVAHISAIERFLLGRTDPPHTPDFTTLPHVSGRINEAIETPIDLRRNRSRDDVLAELRDTRIARYEQLRAGPQGSGDEVPGPFGRPMPVPAMLRMRIFDIWVHEQDLREAVQLPGGLGSRPAQISAATIAGSFGYIWVRRVEAPLGATATVSVVGPGVGFDVAVRHEPPGRGTLIAPVEAPDVAVALAWPDLVALAGGRVPAERGVPLGQPIAGDPDLAAAFLSTLAVTP